MKRLLILIAATSILIGLMALRSKVDPQSTVGPRFPGDGQRRIFK